MEERYIEIRFYYYMLKLLHKFRNSVHIIDVIEAYCNLGGVDSRQIKNLLRQIREHNGLISTYKEEAVYIGRLNKISYRNLEKETGISLSTQVRLNKYYDAHPDMYVNIEKKLPDNVYQEVFKFMRIVDIIKEI
jgi:uncharacterized protein YerC